MVQQHIKEQHGVVVKVKDKVVSYNHSEAIDVTKLLDWFSGKEYVKIILPVRTDEEINHPDMVPHEDTVKGLRERFRKSIYTFIQDPWPDHIKDFDMDDKTFVLRFTYDEGCEMDRTWREWDTKDGYYMLTKEEIVEL
tara:strand:+ start:3538 stop:3951 length:414 start_codon:yes stop_codon:yes gene_type:complete